MKEQYIECEVFIGSKKECIYTGQTWADMPPENVYVFDYNSMRFFLSEAVNIPGFDHIETDTGKKFASVCGLLHNTGNPKMVRFRVPVDHIRDDTKIDIAWFRDAISRAKEAGDRGRFYELRAEMEDKYPETKEDSPDLKYFVYSKPEPPKCEDCAYYFQWDDTREDEDWCLRSIHGGVIHTCKECRASMPEKLDGHHEIWVCGPDGKCFVAKERAANSGSVAREKK